MHRLIALLSILVCARAGAQPLSFVFQQVTTEQGLSTGGVTAICQDQYGYIWLGANNGLSRYDGYGVRVYEHLYGDSNSLMPSQVRNLFCDSEGRLWIGFMHGLMSYDAQRDRFKAWAKGRLSRVGEMAETSAGNLYIAANEGLANLNAHTNTLRFFPRPDSLLSFRVRKMARFGHELYLLCGPNLVAFDLRTEAARRIALPAGLDARNLQLLTIDSAGTVWMATGEAPDRVYRSDVGFQTLQTYDHLAYSPLGLPNAVTALFVDRQQRLWATSGSSGLALYDKATGRFRLATSNPLLPNSLLSNHTACLFQDRQGFIWVGSTGRGASYFHPDFNLFQTILPHTAQTLGGDHLWARMAAETPDGKLWLATSHGLVHYDLASGLYRLFQNLQGKTPLLHSNSVRALCADRRGNLWIGTAEGVNVLRAGAQNIEFLDEKNGFERGFTLGILEDRQGTIWFGTSTTGSFYLPAGEKKAYPLRTHPVLGKFGDLRCQSLFEDSRGLLWFGEYSQGLLCYDPARQTVRYWGYSPKNENGPLGGYIYSFAEDSKGVIWLCSSGGLSAIDPGRDFQFSHYDLARGLPTNRVTTLLIDRLDRLWLGSPMGLLLLDSTRRFQRLFDVHDGLPVNEFSDMPACRLRDGRFLFPLRHGFVLFDPEQYQSEAATLPLLLSGVRVFNRPYAASLNAESLQELYLPPGQNFFTLEMTALHFRNPSQTWYAYKMEPYDREWTYTQERSANYTNVPAGRYTFRYKATADPNRWNVPEHSLRVRVGEIWYRSRWLWGALLVAAVAAGSVLYRRRMRYRKALALLEQKAQALSKEKALVQYENLTQQLNPHFLFNSLASLGSLIRFDPAAAGVFLESLSKMYRYILQSGEHETVSLRDEVAFTEHFIKLQKTRFGESLQIRFNIERSSSERKIVPVTLQNLLENALKHNTLDPDEPLLIDLFAEGDYLVAKNNLQLRPVVETSNKQGLEKLRLLYSYLSDRPMLVEQTDTHFVIKIPLL